MKKTHLIAAAALGTVALGTAAWSGRPAAAPARTTPSAPASSPVLVDAAGFRPSQFEGVSVRKRPATAAASSTSSGRAWLAVRPGARGEISAADAKGASRGRVTYRKQKVTSGLGGDELIPSGLMHATQATRTSSSRAVLQCVPGDGHDHSAHAGR